MSQCNILSQERCIPCEGGVPPFTPQEANQLLGELAQNWAINAEGHLIKKFEFDDFKQAMDFAVQVGALSEAVWHHPTITIDWGLCTIEIWTHKIKGLSRSDFILAAKIEDIIRTSHQ